MKEEEIKYFKTPISCPKCNSKHLEIIEKEVRSWCTRFNEQGITETITNYQVSVMSDTAEYHSTEAYCMDCDHQWKVRKIKEVSVWTLEEVAPPAPE